MDLAFKRFTLTDQQPDTNESYRKLMSHTCQGDNDESQFQMYLATTSNSKTKMSIKVGFVVFGSASAWSSLLNLMAATSLRAPTSHSCRPR